jgi:hypothetical protein
MLPHVLCEFLRVFASVSLHARTVLGSSVTRYLLMSARVRAHRHMCERVYTKNNGVTINQPRCVCACMCTRERVHAREKMVDCVRPS